jgi:hypothetical protein
MLAPLSWIRDFTPADARVDELVAALNQLGLEVESVEEPGRELVGVRVARILPGSDRRSHRPEAGRTDCRWRHPRRRGQT